MSDTTNQSQHHARWKRTSRILALVTITIGAAALIGWIFNLNLLKRIHPSLVTMKANAAICLVLAGVALLLLENESVSGARRRVAQLLAALIAVIGALTLGEHLFHRDFGLDQLLFRESVAAAGQSSPGRMGIAGSLDFLLLGVALLLIDTRVSRRFRLSDSFVLTALVVTLLSFLYYVYSIEAFEPISLYATIAIHTVVALLSLCVGILLARPEQGMIAAFLSDSAGGLVARRMWPAVVAIILLAWLENLGRRSGLFGAGFGTAALVLAILALFATLIWWTTVSLNRSQKRRSEVESALRTSEVRMVAFLEQLPVGVGLVDRDGHWLVLNQMMTRFAGEDLPAGEPMARDRWRAWDEDGKLLDVDEWPIARALRCEAVRPGLEMLYNDQGREIWTRVSSIPFRDHTGELFGAIATIQDINEQKAANEAQWRLAAIVESSEDAIVSKDLDGIIASWNRGAERLFGYSASEAIGKSITILIPAERLFEEPEILARIRRGERIEHFETIRRRKDGTLLDISLTLSPVIDAQGRIIGVSKIAREITARKRAESRLRLLAQVSEMARTFQDPIHLSYAVASAVGKHLNLSRCLFDETDVDQDREVIHRDYHHGVESVAGIHTLSEYSLVTTAEVREGKTVVNRDSQTDSRTASDYRRTYEPNGERAYVAVPLLRENRWVATFWASDTKPRDWTSGEVALLESVAERTWTAIEKLRVDSALRDSEERYRTVLTELDEAFFILEVVFDESGRPFDYRFVEANPALYRHTPFSKDVVGKTIRELVSDPEPQWFEIYGRVATTRRPIRLEYEVKTDTLKGWYEVHAIPIGGPGENRIAAFLKNITARKQSEQRLRESEERLRLATEAAEMYSWEFDLANRTAKYSGYMERVLGFSMPEYTDASLAMVHQDDRSRVQQIITGAMMKGGEFEVEYRLVDPATGREVWVSTAARTIAGLDGSPTLLVGVTQNIAKRKLAEEEREQLLGSEHRARDAAEKANRIKDEFLATLSHELRNPLNVILGYSELLLRAPDLEEFPHLRQISEALKRNALSQSQLINDLLDLSRLQTGKISMNRETVALGAMVDSAVETVAGEAAEKGVHVSLSSVDRLLLVDGDPLRLQQIAWNLLNNAVKFTPPGGSIKVDLGHDDEYVILKVTDSGQGIEPAFLPHIFEMFRQADPSNTRAHGGLGIGLSLVQRLVQLHGGTISATSEGPGKGSQFTVKLPLARAVNLPDAAPLAVDSEALADADVLVVDDSEDTVEMLEQLLKIEGAKVTTATGGVEALQIAAEKSFDAILSDISMPGMDGFEFLRRLRQIPGQQDVPVVAITGFGRHDDIERVQEAGFFSHLTKPVDLERLAEILHELSAAVCDDSSARSAKSGKRRDHRPDR